MENGGRWEEAAVRLLPRGRIEWTGLPARGYVATVAGRVVATVRNRQYGRWHAKVPGWEWTITPEMPIARFAKLSGDKMTHTPVKGYRTSKAARAEVERVLKLLPEKVS